MSETLPWMVCWLWEGRFEAVLVAVGTCQNPAEGQQFGVELGVPRRWDTGRVKLFGEGRSWTS